MMPVDSSRRYGMVCRVVQGEAQQHERHVGGSQASASQPVHSLFPPWQKWMHSRSGCTAGWRSLCPALADVDAHQKWMHSSIGCTAGWSTSKKMEVAEIFLVSVW
jgi:hypothetical protein